MTRYPSLSVILPGPHASAAFAKISFDDVPSLNLKLVEPHLKTMSPPIYTRKGALYDMLAWRGTCTLAPYEGMYAKQIAKPSATLYCVLTCCSAVSP